MFVGLNERCNYAELDSHSDILKSKRHILFIIGDKRRSLKFALIANPLGGRVIFSDYNTLCSQEVNLARSYLLCVDEANAKQNVNNTMSIRQKLKQ